MSDNPVSLVQRRHKSVSVPTLIPTNDQKSEVVHNANSIIQQGMRKRAQSGFSQTIQNQFFSPFRIRPSLETPTKRVDLNEWYRYYFKHDPYVGTAIELHATYPLSNMELDHEDKSLAEEFNDVHQELNLDSFIRRMAVEYWTLGEAFPFGFLDDVKDPTMFERFILLDPDKIKINKHPMAVGKHNRDYFIRLEPDADLKKIVDNGPNHPNTGSLFRNIPVDVIESVRRKTNIELHPLQVSHFKREVNAFNVRGESIISRVLQDLMYLDKLRDAQYAIADRHITPREFYFIGEPGDPADQAELQDFQDALANTYHAYNSAIIWHHAVKVQWEGAQGKVLPLKPEFDLLEKRLLSGLMMSAAWMHGEGPCVDDQTECLTENGWKLMKDVDDGERLATFDKDDGSMKYQNFTDRIVRDYEGEMYYYKSKKYDLAVTPNHWQLFKDRDGEWKTLPVEDMPKDHIQLRSCIDKWDGDETSINDTLEEVSRIAGKPVNKKWFLKFMGAYISEGSCAISPETRVHQVRLCQSYDNDPYELFDALMAECPFKANRYDREDRTEWVICNKELSYWIKDYCGKGAYNKFVPKEIRMLDTKSIDEFLHYLVLGDGNLRHQGKSGDQRYITYTSASKELSDGVFELALKLGYAPILSRPKNGSDNPTWRTYWSLDSEHGKFPWVNGLGRNLNIEHYSGKVYCFEVPSGYIYVRRNGKMVVTHNTFANASVAMDVLIARYREFRERLEHWVVNHVYDPICRMNNIYKPTDAEISHRIRVKDKIKKPWVPSVRWERGALRDDQFKIGLFERMVDKQLISRDSLYKSINISPKQVRQELRDQATEDAESRKKGEPIPGQPQPAGKGLPGGLPPGGGPPGGGGPGAGLPQGGLPPGAPKLPTPGGGAGALPQGTVPPAGAGMGPAAAAPSGMEG